MTNSTIRKFLASLSIASLITLGVSSAAHSASIQAKGEQSQSEKQAPPSTQSVSGKVASIGNGGTSFTLQVNGGDDADKNTLNFLVDKNTRVQGQVKQGTAVTVQYQAMKNGDLLAVSITAQA
jgi:hypothetical protein